MLGRSCRAGQSAAAGPGNSRLTWLKVALGQARDHWQSTEGKKDPLARYHLGPAVINKHKEERGCCRGGGDVCVVIVLHHMTSTSELAFRFSPPGLRITRSWAVQLAVHIVSMCVCVCVCVCVCWAIGHGVHDACMYGVYVTVYACSYIRLCSNTHSYILGLYKWRFTHTDMPCIFLLIFDCQ